MNSSSWILHRFDQIDILLPCCCISISVDKEILVIEAPCLFQLDTIGNYLSWTSLMVQYGRINMWIKQPVKNIRNVIKKRSRKSGNGDLPPHTPRAEKGGGGSCLYLPSIFVTEMLVYILQHERIREPIPAIWHACICIAKWKSIIFIVSSPLQNFSQYISPLNLTWLVPFKNVGWAIFTIQQNWCFYVQGWWRNSQSSYTSLFSDNSALVSWLFCFGVSWMATGRVVCLFSF